MEWFSQIFLPFLTNRSTSRARGLYCGPSWGVLSPSRFVFFSTIIWAVLMSPNCRRYLSTLYDICLSAISTELHVIEHPWSDIILTRISQSKISACCTQFQTEYFRNCNIRAASKNLVSQRLVGQISEFMGHCFPEWSRSVIGFSASGNGREVEMGCCMQS